MVGFAIEKLTFHGLSQPQQFFHLNGKLKKMIFVEYFLLDRKIQSKMFQKTYLDEVFKV